MVLNFKFQVAEIFRPDYGMFVYNDETRTFWFNTASLESSVEFQLVSLQQLLSCRGVLIRADKSLAF
jgi:hypothetical protein